MDTIFADISEPTIDVEVVDAPALTVIVATPVIGVDVVSQAAVGVEYSEAPRIGVSGPKAEGGPWMVDELPAPAGYLGPSLVYVRGVRSWYALNDGAWDLVSVPVDPSDAAEVESDRAAAEAAAGNAGQAASAASQAAADAEATRVAAELFGSAAGDARDLAQAAATAAAAAQAAADDILDDTGAAQAAAQAARDAAQLAESGASLSADASEASRLASVAAAAAADLAKTGAIAAKADSEAAKLASETARNAAQTARDQAQTAATNADGSASAASGFAETAETHSDAAGASAAAAQARVVAAEAARDAASDSATAAATSASSAASHADDAETSASASQTDRVAAQSARDAAAGSATAAAGSASTASTKATEASQSATASQAARVAAESARDTAGGHASAASTSASTAATHADDAEDSAGAAQTSATTATTKAGEASTSASQAATSKTDAAGSASAAATSATNAANSATTAGNSASAASGSASTASTKATEASNSAAAANSSKVAAESARDTAQGHASAASISASQAGTYADDAEQSATSASGSANTATTKASQASTSAGHAATSATNAAGSASQASTSANNAAGSATAAGNSATAASGSASSASTSATNAGNSATAANSSKVSAESAYNSTILTQRSGPILPFDFRDGLKHWSNQVTGTVSGIADVTSGTLISNDPDFGTCVEMVWDTGGQALATKGVLPPTPGRIYEVTARFKVSTLPPDGTVGIGLAVSSLNDGYAHQGYIFPVIAWVSTTGVQEMKTTISDTTANGAVHAWLANAKYLRFVFRMPYSETGGATFRLAELRVTDVTASVAASRSATAAATSASTATTKATEAGSSASAAASSATAAAGSASGAASSASTATTQASNASGSAASAAASQQVAARLSNGVGCLADPTFSNSIVGAVAPAGWFWWINGGTSVIEDTGTVYGSRVLRMASNSQSHGVQLYTSHGASAGAWIGPRGMEYAVIEVDIELVSGNLTGAGIYINVKAAGGANVPPNSTVDFAAEFGVTPPTGRILSVRKVVQMSTLATDYQLYAMNNWASLGPATQKDLRWHRIQVRPATTEEIRTFTVDDEIAAAVSVEQSARVTAIGNVEAKYGVKVEANGYVSGFGLLSTANNAAPTSTFAVLADNFKIAKPGVSGGSPKAMFDIGEVDGVPTLVFRGDILADGIVETRGLAENAVTKPFKATVAGPVSIPFTSSSEYTVLASVTVPDVDYLNGFILLQAFGTVTRSTMNETVYCYVTRDGATVWNFNMTGFGYVRNFSTNDMQFTGGGTYELRVSYNSGSGGSVSVENIILGVSTWVR